MSSNIPHPRKHSAVLSAIMVALVAAAVVRFWVAGKQMDALTWVLVVPAVIAGIILVLRERP